MFVQFYIIMNVEKEIGFNFMFYIFLYFQFRKNSHSLIICVKGG